MKQLSCLYRNVKSSACTLLMLCVAASPLALADTLDLTTIPLATATTTIVKPNLMFILDNSGSMERDHMPEWVEDESHCKGVDSYGSMTTGTRFNCCRYFNDGASSNSSATSNCYPTSTSRRWMPPFHSSDFNGAYYNPETTYSPPKNYDGTEKTSYSGTSNVPLDGYKVQSTSELYMPTKYADVEWCTSDAFTDCLRNDNYLLPGKVNGKSYWKMHVVTSSGTKNFATGTMQTPTVTSRTAGPFYYVIVPGEYCTDTKLTDCKPVSELTLPSTTYPEPAKVRWCKTSELDDCQSTKNDTYDEPRYPTILLSAGSEGSNSIGKIRFYDMPRSQRVGNKRPTGINATCDSQPAANKAVVTSIKLNGVEMLTEAFTYCDGNNNWLTRNTNLAKKVRERIGNGFNVTARSDRTLTISAPDGTYNDATLSYEIGGPAYVSIYSTFKDGAEASGLEAVPGAFKRVDIVSGQTYGNIEVEMDGNTQLVVDRSNRSDCSLVGDERVCTYEQELRNFANWFAWYRTRMQMMKTSVSLAFQEIDNRYRVGFYTINSSSSNYLDVDTFDTGNSSSQKALWYSRLFSADPSGYTPLRVSLANVGRIFAGKDPLGNNPDDPVQYSCQQNFTILTTDGYWNSSSSPKKIDGSSYIQDEDDDPNTRPMYEGPSKTYGTLADVAKYFYETDLRSTANGNCTGALGDDVCENNVFISDTDNNILQHMTSFTLGLGVDGTLQYQTDYKTAESGDFFNITEGSGSPMNWPVPKANDPRTIDDLWHAAVNGRGSYYSAQSAQELSDGLNDALASIGARRGAGAAAATSSLNPVEGDNFAYVASYTTVKWKGNLEARTIDLDTGVVSETAAWCVEDVVGGSCSGDDSTYIEDTSGDTIIRYCATPVESETACTEGTYQDGNCLVELPSECDGTMESKVSASTDSREILTPDVSSAGTLTGFYYGNLSTTQQSYFQASNLSQLSQWSSLTAEQKLVADEENFVKYLRGQYGYEKRDSNAEVNQLFRYREAVVGDAMESEPSYVGQPAFDYVDDGYEAFKTAKEGRGKTVYLGTNDGMLHAFNTEDGSERWAFVPSMVIPNMWKLADFNYATMHTNYVNGSPKTGDVQDGAEWKTILVAGLNGGGRGYYALDVTNPSSPSLLWEIDESDEPNLGYSYGEPVITKMANGRWVVLFTSGHNNVSPGDGEGYLFIRDALTGAEIAKISTEVGDTSTPSGLAKISGWADDPMKNNTTTHVYGGDLEGNVWRFGFEIEEDEIVPSVMKFAVLKDGNTLTQPVTTSPELGLVEGERMVFIATGKYLENSDLTNTQTQSLYAIMDADAEEALNNPRASGVMVKRNLTASSQTATRTSTDTGDIDYTSKRGWYVDFPDYDDSTDGSGARERAHVDPILDAGVLFVPTTVPSSSVCAPGGYSWLNYFDYESGLPLADNIVSQKYDGPIVGLNVYYTPDGKRHVAAVTANNPTPTKPPEEVPSLSTISQFKEKRAIWREIFP